MSTTLNEIMHSSDITQSDKVSLHDVQKENVHNELRDTKVVDQTATGHFDPAVVRRIVLKMDAVLIPISFIVYTFCFIDRASIGNAGIAGFKNDLGLVGSQYNLGVSVFFMAYIAFQAPSNLVLKRVGPKYWLTFLVLCFGAITLATAWVRSFGPFIAARFTLGMVEGGVLSGMALMMSLFYTREEMTLRIGVYMLCASSSGAFGGLLAYGLIQIGAKGSLKSWSWIFLVEGIISIVLSAIVFFVVPKSIETAWFLTPEERKIARARMNESSRVHEDIRVDRTSWKLIRRALFNPLNIICGLTYIGVSFVVQSLAIFTPTILNGLGYTVLGSQLASVWPNLLGSATNFVILFASHKTNLRSPYILGCCIFTCVGFGMLLAKDQHVQYAGVFVASLAAFVPGPLLVGWAGGNESPLTCRAVAIAMAPSLGHLGAIASAWAYRQQDAPRYILGNSLNLAFSAYSAVLTVVGMLYVRYENNKRARGGRDYRLSGNAEEDEMLGSAGPAYRLIY